MLQLLELPPLAEPRSLSSRAERLIAEAERRIDDFLQSDEGRRLPGFVPSDFRAVDAQLRSIVEQRLAPGRTFCEWGSGFGVVSLLAALHGFDACGIEVEDRLVELAQQLADDLGIPAQFVQGSAIPAGGERLVKYVETISHIDTDGPPAYDELDLELPDFDLIYVFPWPGEVQFWEDVFDHYASHGALLLTYHGAEGFRLQRHVRKRRRA